MIPQQTVKYQTYLLTALTDGLQAVFANHVDEFLRTATAGVEWAEDKASYPFVLIRYYERDIRNAGVGHKEWIRIDSVTGRATEDPDVGTLLPFKHSHYHGDVEYQIYAETTLDRALLADSLVQTIRMGDTEVYTQAFLDSIYADEDDVPDAAWHFVNLNVDTVAGMGSSQIKPPWEPEDRLYYTTSYRVGVFGEFYSRVPSTSTELVSKVTFYPYISAVGEPEPEGENPAEPNPWLGDGDELF